jgi:hypothetical protein
LPNGSCSPCQQTRPSATRLEFPAE